MCIHTNSVYLYYIIILLRQHIQKRERELCIVELLVCTLQVCVARGHGRIGRDHAASKSSNCHFFSLSSFQSKICKARAGPLWKLQEWQEWQEWRGLRPFSHDSLAILCLELYRFLCILRLSMLSRFSCFNLQHKACLAACTAGFCKT